MTEYYTKTVRSVWLHNAYVDQTQLWLQSETNSQTQGGRLVSEYLRWLRDAAEYEVHRGEEYTQVTITQAQLTYVLLRWAGIEYATERWQLCRNGSEEFSGVARNSPYS